MSTEIIQTNSQLPADWADKLAMYAKETATAEAMPGNFFSTKSGQLSFAGSPVAGNKMAVCVLASMHENVFYTEAYSADNPSSPGCYAFSFDGKNMAPHSEAEKKQSTACGTCPNNAWGSGNNGRGKACKEQRRLALLPAGSLASPETVATGVVGLLRVPVTSVKHWAAYATKLATLQVPPFAVVTEVSLHPDPKTMIRFEFKTLNAITDAAILNAVAARMNAEKSAMSSPYPKNLSAPQTHAVIPPIMGAVSPSKF